MTGAILGIFSPLLLAGVAVLILLIVLLLQQRKRNAKPVLPVLEQEHAKDEDDDEPDEAEVLAQLFARESVDLPVAVVNAPAASPADAPLNCEFDKLEMLAISGAWEAHLLCRAAENRCKIEIDPAFAPFVKLERVRDGLQICYTGKKSPDGAMSIELSTTGVPKQVKTTGKCRIWIDSVDTDRLVCKATNGGRMEMPGAKIREFVLKLTTNSRAECGGEFDSAELEATGGCSAKIRGSVGQLEVRLSDASKAEAVQAEKADVDVSGASKLKLEVSDKLKGRLSGGSSLKHRGDANASDIRVSGSSKLREWK